ncbi:protein MpPP2C_J [Marchantia polymorpha subsp. ruderalis]|uniref:protein-serine/threonine phosphatase n=2 Tax=Marchantia polymorpha TaxID=3197 RepID=A0AAF6APS7_MARPO|nr:hypothetical protein MARPO_0019s0132 [Marchantia polymorpha]BBM98447.1 hypothetical protein Mp_1g13620 [Marchantia polymorpha subsp. ruderalis]|eukprot:PTQ44717.1 hypothetical protein MARPO_0019s0132 [Marchantia polymorpha]
MGALAKFTRWKHFLCVCIRSLHTRSRNHKRANFVCSVVWTLLLCSNLVKTSGYSQVSHEQEQAAVGAFSLSSEESLSAEVTKLSSSNPEHDDLGKCDKSTFVDEQELRLPETSDSRHSDFKLECGVGDGIFNANTHDQYNVCGVALFQGRRPSQEDRAVCLSSLCLLLSGIENITVGLYAVFDGHGGQEASTFAAEVFHHHFVDHFTQIIESSDVAMIRGIKASQKEGKWTSQGSWSHGSPSLKGDASADAFEASSLFSDEDPERLLPSKSPRDARTNQVYTSIKPSDMGSSFENREVPHKSSEGEREQPGVLNDEARRELIREVLEDGLIIRRILAEALSRAVFSIDTMFSVTARQLGLFSGSTACIVLQVEEDILVANLGDSKAFFCEPSGKVSCDQKPNGRRKRKSERSKADCQTGLRVRDLTRDHRPDRDDERQRIEGAGGFVTTHGAVARVNGKLAVSRSIGDVHLKRYGVIADPEFTGWLKIPKSQSFLTIASDGVFEKLNTQSVCDVLYAINANEDVFTVLGLENSTADAIIAMPSIAERLNDYWGSVIRQGSSLSVGEGIWERDSSNLGNSSAAREAGEGNQKGAEGTEERLVVKALSLVQSMAEAVGEMALKLGTMDNVGTIVLSLRPLPALLPDPHLEKTTNESQRLADDPQTVIELSDRNTVQGLRDEATVVEAVIEADSLISNGTSSSRTWSKSHNRNKTSVVMTQNLEASYCYELIESLPRHAIVPLTNVVEGGTVREEDEAGNREGLLTTDVYYTGPGGGGSVELYREQLVCTPKQTHQKEMKELCRRPVRLSHFLALIGSVPLDSQTLLPDTDIPSDRPVFVPSSTRYHRYMLKKNFARGAFGEVWLAVRRARSVPDGGDTNEFYNSSCSAGDDRFETTEQNRNYKDDRTTYVLKRILVERGNHVYLSGLREKYFGEIFLNASLARSRASKYSSSYSCAHSNPFSMSRFGYCPWRLNQSRSFTRQNSGSRRTENPRGFDRCNIGPTISEEGVEYIARYVESLEVIGPRELWLVFKNEGKSLSSLLYSTEGAEVESGMEGAEGFFTVVQPSPWWHWLKSTPAGQKEMRSILRQLLLAVKACHSRNITHRDIKPENMIVSWKGSQGGSHPSKLKLCTSKCVVISSPPDAY